MRESKVERYLHRAVEAAGGTTRKWVSPGRPGVPDRIVIWPSDRGLFNGVLISTPALVHFVEVKAPGKRARPSQIREHNRLMLLGCVVLVLDTTEKIDDYINRTHRHGI
jgi:hypothetical protein